MKLKLGNMLPSRAGSSPPPSDGDPSPAGGSPARAGGSMKIGTKIFGLVGFCLFLLAAVAGAGIWQMNKIGVEIEGIAERDLPLTEGLTQITIRQLEQAINLERAFRTAEVMDRHHEAREAFETAVRKFEELNTEIEKKFDEVITIAQHAHDTTSSDEERHEFQNVLAVVEKLSKEHKTYDHLSIEVFKLIVNGNLEQALTQLPEIEAAEEALDHSLEKLLVDVEGFTARAAKTVEEHEHFALKLMVVLSGIALIIGTGTAIFLVKRSISVPLSEVVTGIDALTSGDLSLDVKVHYDDEIGAVARAYEIFRENLVQTKRLEKEHEEKRQIEQKRQAAITTATTEFGGIIGGIVDTVSSASAELHSTAQSMASIAEETSNQASSVAAASEQASTNVQTAASATEEMSSSISEINSQVADAAQAAKAAVENVTKTASQMETLTQKADEIGDVISMISDIAGQTNLLALNATIESARAGEAGKGFAVVASEVKALANETAKATEGISELISEIQAETKTAVDAIADTGAVINKLEETSTSIAAAMDEQGTATQEVARNVTEAASGTREVSSNIAGVTQASQEAGTASGQVTSAAEELSGQSSKLKAEVDAFLQRIQAA